MYRIPKLTLFAALTLALALMAPFGEVQANEHGPDAFMATLEGGQEVPPVDTAAGGTGALTLNAAQDALAYDITVNVAQLSFPMTAAHFHNAPTGEAGGVVRTLTFVNGTATGTWTSSDDQPFTSETLAQLLAGNLYINVHTAANPGGELRGQVLPHATPGTPYMAVIDGAQEVPSVTTDANGTGALILNAVQTELEYDITVDTAQLTGPITAAHFHNAAVGEAGGVVRTLTFVNGTATGTWTSSDDQPFTSEMLAQLLAGNLYINVHTAANPGGELRGQVLPHTAPAEVIPPPPETPSVGDTAVPSLVKMSLIASLILLVTGGGLLMWRRRLS